MCVGRVLIPGESHVHELHCPRCKAIFEQPLMRPAEKCQEPHKIICSTPLACCPPDLD